MLVNFLKFFNIFEVRSYLGRVFQSTNAPFVAGERLLNLGCGDNRFPGWVNADFFVFGIRFWKRNSSRPDWMCDFRYPLKCSNRYWDGIFCEHTLEHMNYDEADSLLREILRILKDWSYVRLSVPDLRKYIDFYLGKDIEGFAHRKPGAEAISTLTQGWGHHSVWDEEILIRKLIEAGFVDVKRCTFRQGSDSRLLLDSAERAWESLYVEARKPPIKSD